MSQLLGRVHKFRFVVSKDYYEWEIEDLLDELEARGAECQPEYVEADDRLRYAVFVPAKEKVDRFTREVSDCPSVSCIDQGPGYVTLYYAEDFSD